MIGIHLHRLWLMKQTQFWFSELTAADSERNVLVKYVCTGWSLGREYPWLAEVLTRFITPSSWSLAGAEWAGGAEPVLPGWDKYEVAISSTVASTVINTPVQSLIFCSKFVTEWIWSTVSTESSTASPWHYALKATASTDCLSSSGGCK